MLRNVSGSGLSGTGYGCAVLLDWGARVLYLGPAFGLTPHRNATGVLAVSLDGTIGVADNPRACTPSYREARSVLILPNSLHHLRIGGGRMAFLYVDPFGRDLAALRERMREVGSRAAFDLCDERPVLELFADISGRRLASEEAQQAARELLGVGSSVAPDARIAAAIKLMRDEPCASHALVALSKQCRTFDVALPAPLQGSDRRAAAPLPDLEPDRSGRARGCARAIAHRRGTRRRLFLLRALQQRLPRHVRHDAIGSCLRGCAEPVARSASRA
jgi:hypothetical protein